MISHPFPYRIIRSSRKTLAIQVSVSGQVTVRAPHTMPDSTIQRFLSQKESWILKHLSHSASRPAQPQAENPPLSEFPPQLLYGIRQKNIQKKNRSLRQKNGRNLRPYHDPGTKNPLGKLHQRRKPEFQLAADLRPGKSPGLCCSTRTFPQKRNESFPCLLCSGGICDARV